MKIHVAKAVGAGQTTLAAFDAALDCAGISNYNLIRLSSVIPPKSDIVLHENSIPRELVPGEWGDKLYVVIAEQREAVVGNEAWAGIGWVQDEVTGRGLFVEHEGSSEPSVRNDIENSLNDLMSTRNIDFGKIHVSVVGVKCSDKPVCSLVAAVFQAKGWEAQ